MNKYFVSLFLALATMDLGVKDYIEDTFRKNEERDTKAKYLVFRKVHNKGFCMNTLDKYPFIIKSVSVVMGLLIAVADYQLFERKGSWFQKLGMTFLSAGAISNIYDRLVRGYVIDYIGIKCKNSKLSKITANLADLYIVIGCIVLLIVEKKK